MSQGMRKFRGLIEVDSVLSPTRRKLFHYFWVTFALLLIFSTRPLWINSGEYPQVPFLGGLVDFESWLDRCALGVAFVPLCLMLLIGDDNRLWRNCCRLFLVGMIGLFLLDQHRFQPWAWQFVLIGISSLLFRPRSVAYWWRWLAISLYFFSALSKFDVSFMDELGLLFLRTTLASIGIHVETWPLVWQRAGAFIFPLWELGTALFLCSPRTRFLGMGMAWVMHLILVVILGPWGLNHHAGVLLWNAFFICQAGLLFWPCKYQGPSCPLTVSDAGTIEDRRGRIGAILFTVVLLLPFLEPLGWYDNWPSWGLYASHAERVSLLVHREDQTKLPATLREFLTEIPDEPEWLRLKLDRWSLGVQRAPIYPQGRFQLGVCSAVIRRFGLEQRFRIVEEGRADRFSGMRSRRAINSLEELLIRLGQYRLNARPRLRSFFS